MDETRRPWRATGRRSGGLPAACRRPPGGLGAPQKVGPLLRTVLVPLLVGFAVLMVLLPMLGVSFVAYLVVERVVAFVRRRRAEPAST